jgi:drug/metabolite transporter (DMT)-like permease
MTGPPALGNSLSFVGLMILTGLLSIAVHVVDRSWNRASDVYAMTLWSSLTQLLLVLPFVGLASVLPWGIAGVLLAVGALTAYARISWYRALASPGDSLSRLLPLTHASGFIVLILAYVVLGEAMPPFAAVGGSVMILGAILISLEQTGATFKEFVAMNLALVFVLLQSLARAVNNVSYKWVFNQGDFDFFTVYFYLKVFEFLSIATVIVCSKGLRSRFRNIQNHQAFLVARGLQTMSGLLFIFVLNHMDISLAEPISASGPLFAIAWERLDKRYGVIVRMGGQPTPGKTLSSVAWTLRILGTAFIIGGFLLLYQGKT